MSRLIDVTVPIVEEMPVWPGQNPTRIERHRRIEDGFPANVSRITLSCHAGTHIDAPFHSLADGHGVERWPLETLIGRCYVADVGGAATVTPRVLDSAGIPKGVDRLLIKSHNSAFFAETPPSFHEDFTALDDSGAQWVATRGVKLLGIDYLSVELFANPVRHSTHRILLGAGVLLLESIDLSAVDAGFYDLICMPLKIPGADGAPARVALRTLN